MTIGSDNIIREYVTIHRASHPGRSTVVGSHNFLLGGCHLAHDCQIGDWTTIANGALLAGHVTVGDHAFISGNVVVHQFVHLGKLSMIGGEARVSKDVPPFMLVVGDSQVRGVNVVGMRRAGLSPAERRVVRQAYGILYRSGLNVSHAVDRLRELPDCEEVRAILEFIGTSTRGLCPGGSRGRRLIAPGREDPEAQGDVSE